MAINKTIFTATTLADSLAEVGAWLTENAAVIGATVSTDESGNVLLTNPNGTNFLKFCDNGYSRLGIYIRLDNGTEREHTRDSTLPPAWSSGYVCTDGLALYAKYEKDNTHMWLFIGKTENGDICIMLHEYTSGNGLRTWYCDIENGVKIWTANVNPSISNLYFLTADKAIARTSFAPICFDSGEAAKSLFFTPQTQYPITNIKTGLEMVISANGDEYVYNGIVALKN